MIRSFTPEFEYFIASTAAVIAMITYLSIKHWAHFQEPRFRPQWIILYACSLQAIWGFSLIFFGRSDIAAWAITVYIPDWLIMLSLLASAGMSYYALLTNKSIVWMLPQQAMMMTAALDCMVSVILGHYADGVARPRIFIFRDQLPEILTAIWHTCAIFHRERLRLYNIYHDQRMQCKIS